MALFDFLKKSKNNVSAVPSSSRNKQNSLAASAGKGFPVPAGAPAKDAYAFSGTADAYFYQLLRNCFSEYEVQRSNEQNQRTTAGSDWSHFLLKQNGALKAVVLVVDKHNWNSQEISDTQYYCKHRRIPCVRFIRQFRNDAGYVVDRIRKSLR